MAGIKALRQVQYGVESTPGTAVAATVIWRGEGLLKDETEIAALKESVGRLFPSRHIYKPQVGAVVTLDRVAATYEQLPLILSLGVEMVTAGTPDGAGSGYVWSYNAPISTANEIATVTLRAGDNQAAYVVPYVFCEQFKLSGAAGGAVEVTATLRGRQASSGSFTSGLTPLSVESILFQTGKLYLDDDGGTIGTTQITGSLTGFEFGGPTGWIALHTADGNTYFTLPAYTGNDPDAGGKPIEGKLVFVHDDNGVAERAKAVAGTVRLMRLKFQGSALGTPGTYTCKTFQLDAAIQYTEIPALGDEDGLDTIELPFRVVTNAAESLSWDVLIVNERSVL